MALTELPENYAEIQRAMQEELEEFPFHTLQPYSNSRDFSDPAVCDTIIAHLQAEIRFDMTSVHDVSLRDAWSKVIQGVMEMLPAVEQLLVNFTGVGRIARRAGRRLLMTVDVGHGQFLPLRHPVWDSASSG